MPSLDPLKFDKEKATHGVLVDYLPGIKLRIARMPNPNLEAYMAKLNKVQRRAMRFGNAEGVSKQTMMEAVAHTVLLGWEGLTESDQVTPINYTPETAIAKFKEFEQFYIDVLELAQDHTLFGGDDKGN